MNGYDRQDPRRVADHVEALEQRVEALEALVVQALAALTGPEQVLAVRYRQYGPVTVAMTEMANEANRLLDAARDRSGSSVCKYCGRRPGLHEPEGFDAAKFDAAWDGDGDVCVDCFEGSQ